MNTVNYKKEIPIRKQALVRFLKEYNCYQQFVNYEYEYGNIDDLIKKAMEYNCNEIRLAFSWQNSIEGFFFWIAMSNKWEKINEFIY